MLEKSNAKPIGDVSRSPSATGNCALLESSNISVNVKTPVIFSAALSFVKGVFDLVNKPISVDAVLDTAIRSCKLGGKSFNRNIK